MWKKNPLGASVQGKTVSKPIRSGWYPHPNSGATVWYDSKTNEFRDKVGGPAREALSIGWQMIGGKRAQNLTKLGIKAAKKIYAFDKRSKDIEKQFDKDLKTGAGNILNQLLVNKTDPGFTDVKDTTGITKGKNQVVKDMEVLGKEAATPTPKVENTANMSKKKKEELVIKKKNNPFADVGYE